MDSLTHTVIGACLGEAIAGRQAGKKAMFFGALVNNLPDIDVIATAWVSDTKILLLHRGITHSILMAVLLSPLLAYLFKKIYKNSTVTYSQWLLLFGSGMLVHISLDTLTTYGTGLFEPFSNARLSLNSIFIFDPLFTIPCFTAALVLLFLGRESSRRKFWTKAGLGLSALYLVFIMINKVTVNHVVKKNLLAQNIPFTDFMTTPAPLNNILWYAVAKAGPNYHVAYYSLLDKEDKIHFEKISSSDSLVAINCDPEGLADFKRFTNGYFHAGQNNDTVIFSDLRFGQLGGWYIKNAPFVFNFKMKRNCIAGTPLQQGKFGAVDKDVFRQLFRRMIGKQTLSYN